MNKTVCLIPARGGSRRIPHKNIKDFLGKPIITYPIETAKASGIFDDVYVYTDTEEIEDIVADDCIIAERESADDNETLTQCVLNFIEKCKLCNLRHESIWDYICVLLPTAVFVDIKTMIHVYDKLLCNDVGITFCKYPYPLKRAFYIKDGKAKMYNPETMFDCLADMETNYYDAGQMYFLNVKSFLEQKRIFMNNIYPIIIDAVDIDNSEDWKKAEAFYKVMHE